MEFSLNFVGHQLVKWRGAWPEESTRTLHMLPILNIATNRVANVNIVSLLQPRIPWQLQICDNILHKHHIQTGYVTGMFSPMLSPALLMGHHIAVWASSKVSILRPLDMWGNSWADSFMRPSAQLFPGVCGGLYMASAKILSLDYSLWPAPCFKFQLPLSWLEALIPKHGMLLEISESGQILQCLHDPSGEAVLASSEIHDDHDVLYIGSYKEGYLAKLKLWPYNALPWVTWCLG